MKIPYTKHAFNGLSVLKDETQVCGAAFWGQKWTWRTRLSVLPLLVFFWIEWWVSFSIFVSGSMAWDRLKTQRGSKITGVHINSEWRKYILCRLYIIYYIIYHASCIIYISDFFKKSDRARKKLARAYSFQKRMHKRADEAFIAGDYSKAMASLMMIDRRVSTQRLIEAARESLPKRVRSIDYWRRGTSTSTNY